MDRNGQQVGTNSLPNVSILPITAKPKVSVSTPATAAKDAAPVAWYENKTVQYGGGAVLLLLLIFTITIAATRKPKTKTTN